MINDGVRVVTANNATVVGEELASGVVYTISTYYPAFCCTSIGAFHGSYINFVGMFLRIGK